MDRETAIERLSCLRGQNLRPIADRLEVTVWKDGKLNKGWVGHTIERFLGLPLNSSRSPNFGSWELKVVSLKYLKSGVLVPKETMAITMIDPVEVVAKEFGESHLYTKLRRILTVARVYESRQETSTLLHSVSSFDFDNAAVYGQVKADYQEVRNVIRTRGFDQLTGTMGELVQPRTKGSGHGSTSRAFYARKQLVAHIVGIAHNG